MATSSSLSTNTTTTTIAAASSGTLLAPNNNNTTATTSVDPTMDFTSQLSSLRIKVRNHVHDLAVHYVPFQQSQAYLQAMANDSALVQSETDPIQFVRSSQYDVWAGTQRLCLYWTERLALFGSPRAFLPLTLTGTGALTLTDIQTLHAGYPALLPDSLAGPKCVLVDRRNLLPGSATSLETRLRAWFYIFHVLAQDGNLSHNPNVYLLAVSSNNTSVEQTEDWEFVSQATALMASIFPSLQLHVHLVSVPEEKSGAQQQQQQQQPPAPAQEADEATAAVTAFVLFQPCIRLQINVQLHVHAKGQSNLVPELQGLGMAPRGIPTTLGGEWKLEEWYRSFQVRKEWEVQEYQEKIILAAAAMAANQPHNNNHHHRGPV
ncbi:hypothetical protein ACA910_002206 [Epithemia clementina (nom. ined.)]